MTEVLGLSAILVNLHEGEIDRHDGAEVEQPPQGCGCDEQYNH